MGILADGAVGVTSGLGIQPFGALIQPGIPLCADSSNQIRRSLRRLMRPALGHPALTNPAVLAFVIPAAIYIVFRGKSSRSNLTASPAVALAVMCLTVSPWIIRDYVVFHRVMAIRDNLPLELYLGNHQQAPGENTLSAQVCNSLKENRKLAQMGEIRYLQDKGQQARSFIAAHPVEFGTRFVRRAFYFWVSTPEAWLDISGSKRALFALLMNLRRPLFALSSVLALVGLVIGWRRKIPGTAFFTILLLLPPLPYYLTHGENRYRHPIEPEIMLLAGYAVVTIIEAITKAVRERSTR
jgi:hypothetical protein